MTNEVLVAIISVSGSIVVAAVSYYFTKKQQREAEWRESKLNHYKVLLSSISDLAVDNSDVEARHRFSLAMNTLAIVAPQEVIEAALGYHDGVQIRRTPEQHDALLGQLILAIRRDLGIKPNDDLKTFRYHLVGAPSLKKD